MSVARTWTVTIRYVPEGEWDAFACEVAHDETENLTARPTPSTFGGGSSPYNAAAQALARILPEPQEEGGADVGW